MSDKQIVQSLLLTLVLAVASADFNTDIAITWGAGRGKVLNGNLLQLSLDRGSGSGFQSRAEYLFGRIELDMKLVPGNSAGTVTTYYLSSQGPTHDEIDFEFLGNVTGEPYILHTNVFSQGKGNREQQFYLWFDPRADFHTYSIVWNPQQIIFYVDGTPIRVFRNTESSKGVPYPKSQPMRLYSSLWDAEDWATRGGLVKTDWSQAPFIASYRNLHADACVWSSGRSACSASKGTWWGQSLDANAAQKLRWVRKNYMIYNYCSDSKRFAQGFPPECSEEIAPLKFEQISPFEIKPIGSPMSNHKARNFDPLLDHCFNRSHWKPDQGLFVVAIAINLHPPTTMRNLSSLAARIKAHRRQINRGHH